MNRVKRKLETVVKIFAATVLCVSMSACGSRSDSQTEQVEVQDSVAQTKDTVVDWGNVEQAQRVSEPSSRVRQEEVRRLTVLDFSATWCGPCKVFAPVFHEVAEEYKDQADFRTIDIDQERALAEKYNIQAVPTLVVLDENGKELKRVEGAMSKSDFIELIKELQ